MTDIQAPLSCAEDDCFYDALDHLYFMHCHIVQALDTRKKLISLPMHTEAVPKLDEAISSMVENFGKKLAEVDLKKENYENGEIIDMLYRSAALVEALSKVEGFMSSTGGISKFIDRLVVELADTHHEKEC